MSSASAPTAMRLGSPSTTPLSRSTHVRHPVAAPERVRACCLHGRSVSQRMRVRPCGCRRARCQIACHRFTKLVVRVHDGGRLRRLAIIRPRTTWTARIGAVGCAGSGCCAKAIRTVRPNAVHVDRAHPSQAGRRFGERVTPPALRRIPLWYSRVIIRNPHTPHVSSMAVPPSSGLRGNQ